MTKQGRKLKGLYKYKKRLRNYRITGNNYAFKTTGKPCSCIFCTDSKWRVNGEKKKVYKEIQFELSV